MWTMERLVVRSGGKWIEMTSRTYTQNTARTRSNLDEVLGRGTALVSAALGAAAFGVDVGGKIGLATAVTVFLVGVAVLSLSSGKSQR
jgi:hypothetical protein